MAEIFLVNPSKRKKKATTRKRKKTTAKRKTTTTPARRRRRTAAKTKRRTYKRNPSPRFSLKSFTKATLMPSAVGAVGALSIDMIMGIVPLPDMLKTGAMRPMVKGVAAVGLGLIANQVVSRKVAEQITAGALTVVLYDTMKTFVRDRFPTLPLGEYDDYPELNYVSPAPTMSAYIEDDDMDMMGIDEDFSSVNVDSPLGAYIEETENFF